VRQKNRGRKSVAKKVPQKNHDRKIAIEKVRQKNRGNNMVGVYL
jgi:hypothetical protein